MNDRPPKKRPPKKNINPARPGSRPRPPGKAGARPRFRNRVASPDRTPSPRPPGRTGSSDWITPTEKAGSARRYARPSGKYRRDADSSGNKKADRRTPRPRPPGKFSRAPAKAAGAKFKRTVKTGGDEKVHKILARCGLGGRRQMEELIAAGEVTINGKTAAVGTRAKMTDHITVSGRRVRLTAPTRRVLLYYKPTGKWVSREPGIESVFDDLPRLTEGRWINVGRLDVNTEGLLLFSNDGDWVNRMAHPRAGHEREYRARVNGELTEQQLQTLCTKGILLKGETRKLILRRIIPDSRQTAGTNHWYSIILTEGRTRIVRRLFDHHNIPVSRLIRVRFATHTLPKTLKAGMYQEIAAD